MASGPSSFASAHGLRYRLAFLDDFDGDGLDRGRWLPHDLPHSSSLEDPRARYSVAGGCLTLRFEADQGS